MVSYFVPRGRFLIKAGNFRQTHQKPQHQQGKWPVLRHFRQTFCSKPTANSTGAPGANQTETQVNSFIRRNALSKATYFNNHKLSTQQQELECRRSVWRKWTGFLLRWAPVGICVFGAIEWQLHKQRCEREQKPRTASELQSKIYCSLPLRILSRCWGWLAACYVPTSLRPYVYGWYSHAFGVNLEEALYPDYKYYSSLAEFFTRPLRDGIRTIDSHAPLVSPADGKVLHFGSATDSLIEQVKGVNYSIESFLGPANWSEKPPSNTRKYADAIREKNDGTTALYQCVIYLAPGDYHRFHSPAEWQPTVRRHFDGELLSVSPKIATWLPGLFCLNERVLYLGKWEHGFFSYTAVGATNVGSVQIYMDEQLKTNRWVGLNVGKHKKRADYDEMHLLNPTPLQKGDLVGQFNMGSTIVLLFEAPKTFAFDIQNGQRIRVGEPLGRIVQK